MKTGAGAGYTTRPVVQLLREWWDFPPTDYRWLKAAALDRYVVDNRHTFTSDLQRWSDTLEEAYKNGLISNLTRRHLAGPELYVSFTVTKAGHAFVALMP